MTETAPKFSILNNVKPLSAYKKSADSWHIENILAPQTLTLVHAPSGGMKSLFCLSLSIAIAGGESFLKQNTEPCGVLYLDGEMSENSIAKRSELLGGNNLTVEQLAYMDASSILDFDFSLSNDEQREAYLLELISCPYGVIVIDNIRTLCHIINENDSREFTTFNNWIKKLRSAGKTVIVVHHSNKQNSNGDAPTYAGSSNIITVFDNVWSIAKDANTDNIIEITSSKDRDNTSSYICGRQYAFNDGQFQVIDEEFNDEQYHIAIAERNSKVLQAVRAFPKDFKEMIKKLRSLYVEVPKGVDSWVKFYDEFESAFDCENKSKFDNWRKSIHNPVSEVDLIAEQVKRELVEPIAIELPLDAPF
ncbi:AAA family ATPase [Vibrio diazotrophicus]|uniref:AAA family ATPase n=1 Tax=Vibrio diazotrophicus TaxID=685 RepID=UPI0015E0FACE|nr:AAA family ATPase [Vibrio diazotrophicus]